MSETRSHLLWYPGHEFLLPHIVRAENCSLFDADGNRYVDLESGVWCTSVGHGNERVCRAIADQLARVAHAGFCYSSNIVEEVAREILSLLGFGAGRCVFLCSGSEAVEYGVRAAQMVAPRPLLLTMADSYFGAYGSARRKSEDEWSIFDWAPCVACPHSGDCDERCDHWASIPFNEIGGFLFEPGSSSGLVRFPPEKLVRSIGATVQDADGFVLVNEVTTGIARTGMWFGYQHYDISPDVVAMGKGIGNGYPVSVTAFAPSVVERLDEESIPYAQSHQNDPLGAAVVHEVIAIIEEEGLIERGRWIALKLRSGLDAIAGRTDRIAEIRSRGLMVGVELKDDDESSFTIGVHRELVRRGYVVGRRPAVNVLRIDPAPTIDPSDIDGFLETFEAVLTEVGETS